MRFADYPFASRYFSCGAQHMHYLDEGREQSSPVLMLHGNPSWSYFYRHLILALRPAHRCIVPDHVGMGLSSRPAPGEHALTLEQRVRDLDALLRRLRIRKPVHLVVHDWGGMIGFAWVVRNPDRVGKILVMNSAAFPLPQGRGLPFSLKLFRTPALGAHLVLRWNLFCLGALRACLCRRGLTETEREAWLAPYDTAFRRRAVHAFVKDIPLRASHPSWRTVEETAAALPSLRDKEMLICWGMRDFVFDRAFLNEWRTRFPAAEAHQFTQAGHYVLEDERERIVSLAEDFFREETRLERE